MKIAVIINNRTNLARSESGLRVIKRKLPGVLHSIAITASAGEAACVLRRAVSDKIDTAVVAGGDGTVNGVLNIFAGSGIALGVIPCGTANDLCSMHHLPAQLSTACDVILRRQLRAVDLISANGRYFVTGGGLGFPSTVAAIADGMRSGRSVAKAARAMLGSKLYVVSAALALVAKPRPPARLAIQSDRGALETASLALMISNQPLLGKHFYVAPQAVSDDGQFEVCAVGDPRSRIALAAVVLRVLNGSHAGSPLVTTWRARELEVRSAEPLPFYADGEHLVTANYFAVKIVPRSLNLIVPAHQAARSTA